jgi:hypothetical protein
MDLGGLSNACLMVALFPMKFARRASWRGNSQPDSFMWARTLKRSNLHSSKSGEATRYLTLSHCWGGKTFTTLRRKNLEAFRDAIPIDELSKTFRDAITVTRNLGYRCLWIDSICIIQGDKEDWKQKSALMGNIYANTDLNIGAVDSPDGDTGLFFNRLKKQIFGWKVNCGVEAGSSKTRSWHCTPKGWRRSVFDSNVLSSRAWVFQERFLARRMLNFGARELTWEC